MTETKASKSERKRRLRGALRWDLAALGLGAVWMFWDGVFSEIWLDFAMGQLLLAGVVIAIAISVNHRIVARRLAEPDARDDDPIELEGRHPYRGEPKVEPPTGRSSWVVRRADFVWLVIALCVAAVGWYRTLNVDPVTTGMRTFPWTDERGQTVVAEGDTWFSCGGRGLRFSWLQSDGALWFVCHRGDEAGSKAMSRIDVRDPRGSLAWPFPTDLDYASMLAILPGSDGRIAIAYRTTDHGIAAGVIGADGWDQAPELVSAQFGKVLGLAWKADDLVVAYHDSAAGVMHWRRGRKEKARRPACEEGGCRVLATWREGTHWCSLVLEGALIRRCTGKPDEPVAGDAPSYEIFVEAAGTLRGAGGLEPWVYRKSGVLEPITRPEGVDSESSPIAAFLAAGDHVEALSAWSGLDNCQSEAGRVLCIGRSKDENRLFVSEPNGESVQVAQSSGCGFQQDYVLTKVDAGFRMIAPDGCYATMSDSLERVDPLSLTEYVRRGEGQYAGRDRSSNVVRLFTLRYGMVPAMLLPLLLGLVMRDRERYPVVARKLGLACAAYSVFAAAALGKLWPLL